MTYTTNLTYHPNKYHYSYVRDLDSTGTVVLTVSDLNLPDRSTYIEVDVPPDYGVLKLNGVNVLDGLNHATPTQITKVDIDAGLLVWDANQADASVRLNFDYFAYDAAGETQSMLYHWLPFNIQPAPSEVVDGGDFDTGTSDGGVSADGGDFASGINSTLLQSYDGGDFNTGAAAFPEPPAFTNYATTSEGPLLVVDPDTGQTVPVSSLPSSHELFPRNASAYSFDFTTQLTFYENLTFKTKQFRGWDYGARTPNYGHRTDAGTIQSPSISSVDFNNIVNYSYPYPPSRAYSSAP